MSRKWRSSSRRAAETSPIGKVSVLAVQSPIDHSSGLDDELAILDSIPARDSVLNGIRAIDGLKERLRAFLEPFRGSGRIVTRQDVDGFFASIKEEEEEEEGKGLWS